MKRLICLLACLCLLVCLLPGTALAVDESRSYNFDLSIGGEYEVKASTDQVLTVQMVLKRTDSAESADMYGMQTELWYDDTFFQLVDSSVMTAPGVKWTDMGRRTGGRAFYLNFVSFSGGESWEPEVVVGSFQLKVIGTNGVSQIIPQNDLISTKDGYDTYSFTDNSVTVIVSTECTVTFEENGGTEVPDQIVQYGEKVVRPEDPIREGYHLEGWYSDLDRTKPWDFDNDTVKGNMTLYAGWAEGDSVTEPDDSSFPWWILFSVAGAGLLLVILLLVFGKKKVTFETDGGTPLEPVRVRRGSLLEEPMTPVKPGAMFIGWYRDPEFTKPWRFERSKVYSSMKLYARWK